MMMKLTLSLVLTLAVAIQAEFRCNPAGIRERCPYDACDGGLERCADDERAECRANRCGGCEPEFFQPDGTQVCCPENTAPGYCPPAGPALGGPGICVEECSEECDTCQQTHGTDFRCCSNGCGHTCRRVITDETGCLPGVELVRCLVNPCDVTTCARHPEAECIADYCGECSARFVGADGDDVECGDPIDIPDINDDCPESDMVECLLEPCSTAQCTGYPEAICHNNYCGVCQAVWKNPDGHPVTCDRFSPPECATSDLVPCETNPCDGATCRGFPDATCHANYCGGCNSIWYTTEGLIVDCDLPLPDIIEVQGRCPEVPADSAGICVQGCDADSDCEEGSMCCSNGCGHVCTRAVYGSEMTCDPAGIRERCPYNACDRRESVCGESDRAICQENRCGGCEPEFFLPEGAQICCPSNPTIGDCPAPSGFGICIEECSMECDMCAQSHGMGYKCCSNGCGSTCVRIEQDNGCLPGVQVANCLLNPCDVTECPAHPEAVCNADYCGGCHARFYNADGEDVDCGAARGPNALDDGERTVDLGPQHNYEKLDNGAALNKASGIILAVVALVVSLLV